MGIPKDFPQWQNRPSKNPKPPNIAVQPSHLGITPTTLYSFERGHFGLSKKVCAVWLAVVPLCASEFEKSDFGVADGPKNPNSGGASLFTQK